MRLQRLSSEEMRQTLRRAAEIAQQAPPSEGQATGDELEAYLDAAEEAGLPRKALLQALREKHLAPADAVRPGDFLLAPSADGNFYVATVEALDGPVAQVAFHNGGTHLVARTDLRPLAMVPGRKIQFAYDYGAGMGESWVEGQVQRFDPINRVARISSTWYGSRDVPLTKIRVKPEKPRAAASVQALLWRTSFVAGGLGVGLGYLFALLTR